MERVYLVSKRFFGFRTFFNYALAKPTVVQHYFSFEIITVVADAPCKTRMWNLQTNPPLFLSDLLTVGDCAKIVLE
jgi:hypothetical protein